MATQEDPQAPVEETPKNTVESIAAKINQFHEQFQITKEQVCVTATRQEGENVRVFFTINNVKDLTEEEAAKVRRPVIKTDRLIPDPFADGGEGPGPDPDPEPEDIKVTSITVAPLGELTVGTMADVAVSVLPNNATDPSYTAVSSDETIVGVLNSGAKVSAKKAGTAIVTYTANDGSGKKATLQVKVVAAVVEPTGITSGLTDGTEIKVGETITVAATIAPANATDKTYTVTSSDPTVISVAGKVLTAVKVGVAEITCTTTTGGKTSKEVIEVVAAEPTP